MRMSFRVLRGLGMALVAPWVLSMAPALAQAEGTSPEMLLHRGVNIVGYDPIWKDPAQAKFWKDPTQVRFQPRHMEAIKRGGFDHVRFNLHAFAHMDAEHRLSAAWWATLDSLVGAALKADLKVIIDQHNFIECATEMALCRARLKAFWRQVSQHFKGAPPAVIFEILNEPNGEMDAVWNDVLAENLQIIRESHPDRWVIVGPKGWNSMAHLDSLRLPEADRHLLVTFHYYTPMEFTHQGAYWTPEFQKLSGITWGSAAERDRLAQDMDQVLAWSQRHQRPILMGEFGALESAGLAQRAAWDEAVARAAEARGFAWSYWQFDSDFILWDMAQDDWVQPVHCALVPAACVAARGQ